MRVFSYKVTRDYGFAPNPFHGVCTLATCKPNIRNGASVGDLVFGCGSKANNRVGMLIYAMRVNEILTFHDYWNDPRFMVKRPNFHASIAHAYGDNIYHKNARGRWVQARSHHSLPNGGLNTFNLRRDTNRSQVVLVSEDFVYFGRNSIQIPKRLRSYSADDLYPSVRDYRSRFDPVFVKAIVQWFEQLPRGFRGRPINWD